MTGVPEPSTATRPDGTRVDLSRVEMTDEIFAKINAIIEERFGLTFPLAKKSVLTTRLRSRLADRGVATFADYLRILTEQPKEITELARAVTNNETYFFRERQQFEVLFRHGRTLLPPDPTRHRLRVLCAGSSSGEEAYTLNFFAKDPSNGGGPVAADIAAFDIDVDRVGIARRATYRGRSLRAMDEAQVERFLVSQDSGDYLVKPEFRDGVRFDTGNIVEVATFRQARLFDVVFCRNVLIYFSARAFTQAIENFASVLRVGGLLFLGHAESLIGRSTSFDAVRLGECIVYRRAAP